MSPEGFLTLTPYILAPTLLTTNSGHSGLWWQPLFIALKPVLVLAGPVVPESESLFLVFTLFFV